MLGGGGKEREVKNEEIIIIYLQTCGIIMTDPVRASQTKPGTQTLRFQRLAPCSTGYGGNGGRAAHCKAPKAAFGVQAGRLITVTSPARSAQGRGSGHGGRASLCSALYESAQWSLCSLFLQLPQLPVGT